MVDPVQLHHYKKDQMKEVTQIAEYKIHDKAVLMVGDNYKGSPIIMWPYDILMGSRAVIDRYKQSLIPRNFKGHKIKIQYV